MSKKAEAVEEKYNVEVVRMLRNNSIATGEDHMDGHDTYFMLDYFDLLFHRSLTDKNKTYKGFWDIGEQGDKSLGYKAAYKTLSLFAERGKGPSGIFKVQAAEGSHTLSTSPFLGIIQIDFIHGIYGKTPSTEEILTVCEEKIVECLTKNICMQQEDCYRIYRSSTSGDFCLAVKSGVVEKIFRIATLINNLTISWKGEKFGFNTYTNIGIECLIDEKGMFRSFREDTVQNNNACVFALRITTDSAFARQLFDSTKKKERVLPGAMEGLVGRYDFLLYISMEEFAKLYSALCESKLIRKDKGTITAEEGDMSTVRLLQTGIGAGRIKVINERVLVPLSDHMFGLKGAGDISVSPHSQITDREGILKEKVITISERFVTSARRFQDMEKMFLEERRVFIDVSRELWEVVNTYVPQGMEYDSHVNWQILISDLQVTFDYIERWKDSYEHCSNREECKYLRMHFLNDLRLIIDAIDQYYKFLQNVNAQTRQSPLYEIQTQLDAEKMMIAYREFLYEYFYHYRESYKGTGDERPMLYPIVYPTMLTDVACAMKVFQNEKKVDKQLLICQVPSFEYYGRMFDMIPQVLHEASHSIRVMDRADRNHYLAETIIRSVFEQAMYKLLNQYSNDFGYYSLGVLENEILDHITEAAVKEFAQFCREQSENIDQTEFAFLETELERFLHLIFARDIHHMQDDGDEKKRKAFKATLMRFLGSLGQFDLKIVVDERETVSALELIEHSLERADSFLKILEQIYMLCFEQMTDREPEKDRWHLLLKESDFEEGLKKEIEGFGGLGIGKEKCREYCFDMRELNRLYSTWHKYKKACASKDTRTRLWRGCIPKIRETIDKGFETVKGSNELYRILNMVFGNGSIDDAEVQRIGTEWDILLWEEVSDLIERGITIYRESNADLFMAATLGLTPFGYCRQMFQTTSDAAIEDHMGWEEATNIHRFRAVAAVLAGQHCAVEEVCGRIQIPMDMLLVEGKEYCDASLDCAEQAILGRDRSKEEDGGRTKDELISLLFRGLHQDVELLFGYFHEENFVKVKEVLDNSLLAIYLDPGAESSDEDVEKAKKGLMEAYGFTHIQGELEKCKHVIYRIKCFIMLLDIIGEKEKLVVDKKEYEHLKILYTRHWDKVRDLRDGKVYKVVAGFYNKPGSALAKTPQSMLEDTIDFIQTYYYKNRFEIMSSEEVKEEAK